MPTPTSVCRKSLALQGKNRVERKTPIDPDDDPSDPISALSTQQYPIDPEDPALTTLNGLVHSSSPRPKSRLDKALDTALETVEDRQREETGTPRGPSLLRAEDKAFRKVTEMLASAPPRTLYGMGKDLVVARLKSLQGRMLTIVDASFQDHEQRKAVKTLVSKEFRLEIGRVSDFFGDDGDDFPRKKSDYELHGRSVLGSDGDEGS